MLERATECLEHAGQRLLWQSRNIVRSRRSLRPRFWHHGEIDIPAWCFVFLQSALRAPGGQLPHRHARTSTYDSSYQPRLDFLYPSRGRNTSQVYESRKHHLGRKRRKIPGSSSRNYVSSPSKHFQGDGHHGSHTSPLPSEELLPQETGALLDPDLPQAVLEQRLSTALADEDLSISDEVWALYQSIENREEYSSWLLRYLAKASRDIDAKRLRDVLLDIPVDLQNRNDYYFVTKSLLHSGQGLDSVRELIREAVARDLGVPCWSHAFVYSLSTMQWTDTCDLWQYKPSNLTTRHILTYGSRSDIFNLAERVLRFTNAMEAKEVHLEKSVGAAKFLLHVIFSSPEYMERSSVKEMLNLTQNYHNLSLLEPAHYSAALRTLVSLQLASTLERSILLYRNYCWRMTERPPYEMMTDLFGIVCGFGKPWQIHYILDEFRFFYKMSALKYRRAADVLSKAGDFRSVDLMYGIFQQDYKKETHPYYYIPYLYVHAKLGRVEETRLRFEELGALGIERNGVVWNVLLMAHTNATDFRGAFSLFEKMIKQGFYNSYTFGMLMAMCAKNGDTDTIMSLFEVARHHNVPITAPLVDAAVESSLHNQKLEEAEKIAEEAIGTVKGNLSRMWNMIIVSYAYRSDLPSAMRIRNRMQQAKITQDSKTYSALMLALSVAGRTDEARQLLREMHLKLGLDATEFHYSILLQGYSRERNRDMVNIIYHETMERFGSSGSQSRHAVIRANVHRDLQLHYERHGTRDDRSIKLAHAEQSLSDAVDHFTPELKSSAHDELMRRVFPAAYYEYLIEVYGTKGAFERVDALLDEYKSITKTGDHPIRLLSTLMLVHTRRAQYDEVCACWDMAFARATRLASRPDEQLLNLSSRPQPHTSAHPTQFAIRASMSASSENERLRVHQAHRFVLSKSITYYIQALAFQGHHSRIPDIIEDIEKKGFSLSTQNWSMYVKMMASSEKPEDQLRAFTLFEEKFMPNFLGWKHIIRGYGKRPDGAPSLKGLRGYTSDGKIRPREYGWASRRLWTNIQPDFMQPTYVTMMYLGSALLDYRERSVSDAGSELKALVQAVPKTFAALVEMPYMRDKFQSLLLRGRGPTNRSSSKAIKFSNDFVFTGGVLGDGGPRLDTSPKSFLKEHSYIDDDDDEEGMFDNAPRFTGLGSGSPRFAGRDKEDSIGDNGRSTRVDAKPVEDIDFDIERRADNGESSTGDDVESPDIVDSDKEGLIDDGGPSTYDDVDSLDVVDADEDKPVGEAKSLDKGRF